MQRALAEGHWYVAHLTGQSSGGPGLAALGT